MGSSGGEQEEAKDSVEKGDLVTAIRSMEQAVRADPKQAANLFRLTRISHSPVEVRRTRGTGRGYFLG
jgi:hypothetical protein